MRIFNASPNPTPPSSHNPFESIKSYRNESTKNVTMKKQLLFISIQYHIISIFHLYHTFYNIIYLNLFLSIYGFYLFVNLYSFILLIIQTNYCITLTSIEYTNTNQHNNLFIIINRSSDTNKLLED